jgi:anti-sigma factor RsiW
MADTWTDRLSAFIDDELPTDERAELQAHLATCATCREDLDGLRQVQQWAADYPGTPVHADVWQGVVGAIRARRVVGLPPSGPGRWRRFNLPLALAASLAFFAVGAGSWWAARATAPSMVSGPAAGSSALFAPRQTNTALLAAERYGAAVAQLEQVLLQGGDQLDTGTVRVVRSKLAVIDRAIAEAREALAKDPGSTYLADHFANMMRTKLNLLRSVSAARQS